MNLLPATATAPAPATAKATALNLILFLIEDISMCKYPMHDLYQDSRLVCPACHFRTKHEQKRIKRGLLGLSVATVFTYLLNKLKRAK